MTNLKPAAALALAWVCLQEKDPNLALQLPLDDGKIEEAVGKAVGKVGGGGGKKGGALKFDGAGGQLQLANSDATDKIQSDSYTLAAWFKPDDVPPGTESDNNARYGILVKEGWHTGLSYNNEKQLVMEHWLAPAAGSDDPVWAGAGT